MPTRTERVAATPGFVADPPSMTHNSGRQISWDDVPAAYADDEGNKSIPAGTAMSQLASGQVVPRVDRDVVAAPTEAAIGLLVSSAQENDRNAALSGYGIYNGGVVYENLLPDFEDAEWTDGTIPDELAAAGTGFAFETYEDDRVV